MIFPVGVASFSGVFVLTTNEFIRWFSLLSLIIVSCKREKRLMFACLFCGFLSFTVASIKVIQQPTPPYGEQENLIQLIPDTLKVSGDLVRFEATVVKNKSQRMNVSYFLQSKNEKEAWLKKGIENTGLDVSGKLTKGEVQRNLNGFNARRYQQVTGIVGNFQMDQYQIHPVKRSLTDWFSYYRAKGIQQVENNLSKKSSSYVNALLFNYKNEQFQDIQAIFSVSGLLHLFSLSGMHVQAYFGMLYFFLRRNGFVPNHSFWILGVFSLFLLILSGFGLSVLRAVSSYIVKFYFKKNRVRISSLDCWSLVCLFMLLVQPYLFFQTAGQLTMGLTFIMTVMEDLPIKNKGLRNFCTSIGIGLLSFPIILGTFSEIPVFSGIFTYFISPIFQWFLLPSVIIVFFFSFSPNWFHLPLLLFDSSLTLLEKIIQLSGSFTIRSGQLQFWQIIPLFVLGLFTWQFLCQKRWRLFSVCFFLFLIPTVAKYIDPKGMIAFVDVGQGDSIYFQSPFHQEIILLDTGGKLTFEKESWKKRRQKNASEYQLIPFLKSQGVTKIDKLILTHGDQDHMGEWLTVAQNFQIDQLIIPIGMKRKSKIEKGIRLLQEKGTKVLEMKKGQTITGEFQFSVLSPEIITDGGNEDSLVLGLNKNNHRFLFTGDLGKTGEQNLMENYPNLQTDILKVGHHGSKNSSGESFIQAIKPKISVISSGKENRFGHPNQEVLSILTNEKSTIFRTDLQGMIYYQWWGNRPKEEFDYLIKED